MGIRKSSPYKAIFQDVSKRLVESGQLQIITKRFSPDDSQCSSLNSEEVPAISFQKTFTLFLAFFIGSIVLPIILATFERILFKKEQDFGERRMAMTGES